jgi:hypothetical protein
MNDAMKVQSFSAEKTVEEKLKVFTEEKKRKNEKKLFKPSNRSKLEAS